MRKIRWKKLLAGAFALGLAALGVLAVMISHNTDCPPTASGPVDGMQAVQQHCYGDAEALRVERIAIPAVGDDEMRVRVHAASLNALDKHFLFGTPYIVRLFAGFGAPDDPAVGVDFAGVVDATGPAVTRFSVGDRVFGAGNGAFAEFVTVRETGAVVKIPPNVSFDQAAGLPIAATTALQALRDKAKLQPGQRVLINGASGGVGTAAVQIAKAMGAHVTGVCSGRNVALVQSLGADEVIDYTERDFTNEDARFDVVIDIAGNHSIGAVLEVINAEGVLVSVGDAKIGAWVGPFVSKITGSWASLFATQRIEGILAQHDSDDLRLLADYMARGELRTAVDRRFPLADAVEAMRYFQQGRTRGKVIIDVAP